MQANQLIINYITLEEDLIIVGATDKLRWQRDIDAGMSGVDAKTIVCVNLEGLKEAGVAPLEHASFHCLPGDPVRALAMQQVGALFDIAWQIKNEGIEEQQSRTLFYGYSIQ